MTGGRRLRKLFACVTVAWLWQASGAVALTIFTDETSFSAAIATTGFLDFESIDTSGGAVSITGSEAIFTSQGMSFVSASPTPAEQPLFVEPTGFFTTFGNFLSPNGRPFTGGTNDDDSLSVSILGLANAFGIRLIDGALSGAESIQVFGASGLLHTQIGSGETYFGIIADEAVTQIIISELAGDGDDVGYDNLRIGTSESFSVSAPAANGLFLLGLILAVSVRRRRYS